MTTRRRRIRSSSIRAAASRLEDFEPRTTAIISDLSSAAPRRWTSGWLVERRDSIVGAATVSRLCADVWTSNVFALDDEAAVAVGEVIERSPAVMVCGRIDDVERVAPHVPRVRQIDAWPWAVAHAPVDGVLGPPSPATRLATPLDLDALVALYRHYEYAPAGTTWQQRQFVRRALDYQSVIVHEDEGTIDGAAIIEARSRRFMTCSDLTVLPAHRRRGIAWHIIGRFQAVCAAAGVGALLAITPSNPMTIDHERVDLTGHFAIASAEHRRSGRLASRARHVVSRIGYVEQRAPEELRDDVSTQRW